jgi:hypothetical protein
LDVKPEPVASTGVSGARADAQTRDPTTLAEPLGQRIEGQLEPELFGGILE